MAHGCVSRYDGGFRFSISGRPPLQEGPLRRQPVARDQLHSFAKTIQLAERRGGEGAEPGIYIFKSGDRSPRTSTPPRRMSNDEFGMPNATPLHQALKQRCRNRCPAPCRAWNVLDHRIQGVAMGWDITPFWGCPRHLDDAGHRRADQTRQEPRRRRGECRMTNLECRTD